jgi:hypothetical protein
VKNPKFEQKEGEDFFDAFERHIAEHDRWRKTTWAGRLNKLWWSIKNAVRKAYWFVRYETTDRYHFLDLRGHGYKRGYLDYDEVFLRAAFRCLELMEEEDWGLKDVTEADLEPETPEDPWAAQVNIGLRKQIAEYAEFKELLRWWREEWPKVRDLDNHHDIEDEMLGRLLKLRRGMWA